jgi:hypothetical protein
MFPVCRPADGQQLGPQTFVSEVMSYLHQFQSGLDDPGENKQSLSRQQLLRSSLTMLICPLHQGLIYIWRTIAM